MQHNHNPSEWPPQVRNLNELCSRPLPSWLAHGPYPSTSSRNASLIAELTASATILSRDQRYDDGEMLAADEDPGLDSFTHILDTVANLRASLREDAFGERPDTLPFWYTFLRAIGQCIYPNAIMM